jgi:hypothetical protein
MDLLQPTTPPLPSRTERLAEFERRELVWLQVVERVQLIEGYGPHVLDGAPRNLLEQVLCDDLPRLLMLAADGAHEIREAREQAAHYRQILGQVSDLLRHSIEAGR